MIASAMPGILYNGAEMVVVEKENNNEDKTQKNYRKISIHKGRFILFHFIPARSDHTTVVFVNTNVE